MIPYSYYVEDGEVDRVGGSAADRLETQEVGDPEHVKHQHLDQGATASPTSSHAQFYYDPAKSTCQK